MDNFVAHDLAAAQFDEKLRQLTRVDQWDLATPCMGWDVQALVQHVVGGNRMAVSLLGGATADEASSFFAEDQLGTKPADAYVRSAAAQAAAFRVHGALNRTIHHPAGDMPAPQLLGFRIADLTVHAWDLARALRIDETIDADLVAHVYEGMLPMADMIGTLGMFGTGPSGSLTPAASVQDRLLDLTGRRP